VGGVKSAATVGSKVRDRLPNIISVGARPSWADGVFLKARIARKGSSPDSLAFVISRLAVLTADSAFPLLWAYLGLGVVVLNSQAAAKSRNSCAPLT